jgi:hypothetical protein
MSPICLKCGYNNDSESKFCRNCGNLLTEYTFEIKETFKKSLIASIICLSFFVVLMIITNVALFVQLGSIPGFIGMAIIWPLSIFLFFWARYYLRGASKTRRFVISNDLILIEIPNRELFQILWTSFNSIEIHLRTTVDLNYATTTYYNLIFKMGDTLNSFEIESGREFSKKALKQIRAKLEEISNKKGIKYTYFKKAPS